MKKHIDHIAFRVKDVNRAVKHYTDIHNFKIMQEMDLKILGSKVKSFVLRQGDVKPYIFISEGFGSNNIVKEWVKEHGNAMHHIAYIVDDIRKEVSRLKHEGIKFTTPDIIGSYKFSQIFSVPNKETGLIHEIIERNSRDAFFAEQNVEQLINSTKKYSHLKLSHD